MKLTSLRGALALAFSLIASVALGADASSPVFLQVTANAPSGTPPFIVTSPTKVVNLYADRAAIADAPGASFPNCGGDSGSGGTKGLVPAPAAGDAAAGKVLKANCAWGSGDSLHLKDFGAVGDNVADDTTALQNWINSCQTNNKVCYLDFGNYKISSTLTCNNKLHIVGFLSTLSTIRPNSATLNALDCTTNAEVVLEHFGIIYPSPANAGTHAIKIATASGLNYHSKISHLYISDAYHDMEFVDAVYLTIDGNLGTGSATANAGASCWRFNNTAANGPGGDNHLVANTCAKSGNSGCLLINSGSGIRWNNNKCVGDNSSGSFGISYDLIAGAPASGMSDINVDGGSIENKAVASNFKRNNTTSNLVNVTISNVEVLMPPAGNGVGFNINTDATGPWIKNIKYSGNVIHGGSSGPSSYCFILNSASKVLVHGNTCYNAGGTTHGMSVGSALSGLASDNEFSSLTSGYIGGGSTTFLIKDNQGMASGGFGIAAQNGTQIFMTDGAPGSSPCTGGSTGAMAFRQNGAWKCF